MKFVLSLNFVKKKNDYVSFIHFASVRHYQNII